MGEQVKGAFTLSFPPRMGKPVLPEPLFENWGLKGPTPSTQRCVHHCSFRVVEVCPVKEEGLSVVSCEVSVCTSFIYMVTEGRKLFTGGSYNHGSICQRRCDLGCNNCSCLMEGNPGPSDFVQGSTKFGNYGGIKFFSIDAEKGQRDAKVD